MSISFQQIYDKYFEELNNEFNEEKVYLDSVCVKIDSKINDKYTIKDNCPSEYILFSEKYLFTACSALRDNEVLFIKSAIETNKLCENFNDYIKSKLT